MLPSKSFASVDTVRVGGSWSFPNAAALVNFVHRWVPVKECVIVQVYTHPTDPSWQGYRPESVFYGSEVGNRLPSSAYASYDLVEAARSMLAVALQGEPVYDDPDVQHQCYFRRPRWQRTETGEGAN